MAAASGSQFGFARSVPLISGFVVGMATLIGIVGGGLGAVVLSIPELLFGLRIVGSVYLLWLAWTIGNLGKPSSTSNVGASPIGLWKGVLMLWLNPKGWTMAVGAASAYAGLSNNPVYLAMFLGLIFGLAAALSLTLWCLGGEWLSRALKTGAQWRALNVTLGLLLAASVIPMWR